MKKHLSKEIIYLLILLFMAGNTTLLLAQKKKPEATPEKPKSVMESGTFGGLKFRSIGPAFTSGRIADILVDPNNTSIWYVGVASGNVWKTTNNGHTFSPIFDNYGAYSIGALAMDPKNANVIWLGTGENNHQRALGYGDGVYKSVDGGKSWQNLGLKESRQIGMIAIHPENTNTVLVAAEGSVWGPGGDRGLYKTTDGGKTWKKVLEISENTGVNNVIIDHKNPNIMYATSEQRRRHFHTKIGGGPESAVYKSEDGGETWRKIMKGLPSDDIGGMGIAISPVNTDYIFLIVEAQDKSGGFFRSTDRGESWSKMSSYASSGQYYNEIYCDPTDIDKIYSTETVTQVTIDGGKTWKAIGLKGRHVDDHAMWINPQNTSNFIIGGDGGLYITYDAGENYRFISNLPVTQYYRVAVDNSEPFYWVYGGTQDNNSMGGPSANTNSAGVASDEWIVTIGGDGFFQQIDPKDPNIVYSEYQYGNIYRYDKKSGESLYIKPQPRENELTYKWNWNTPFLLSPFNNQRLYMGANKVFMSNDRGQSWTVISEDLTANIDRTNTWKVMGKYWPADAVAKDVSSSQYGTIVSLAESSVKENLLYAGTDDGLIQVCENTAEANPSWRKTSSFPGVPEFSYVSDILPSKFNENVVFASFSNLKRDDFKPYLLKSTDKGKSWTAITNGLPVNGTVHTIEQDFKNENLLFCGTEFGAYFSVDGGANWIQFKAGLPTIAVFDMTIQKRESDLVLATFGRGFYILDDYSPLREVSESQLGVEAKLFPVKDALMFIQTEARYGQGSTRYYAENPEFGATFTYFVKEVPKTALQLRKEKEKELFKNSEAIPQPTWKEAELQEKELSPYLVFIITDEQGNVIRKISKSASAGINRVNWDLRYASPYPVRLQGKEFNPTASGGRGGMLVMPGKYKVSMAMVVNEEYKELAGPIEFTAKSLNNTTLPAPDRKALVDFQLKVSELARVVQGAMVVASELTEKTAYLKQAALNSPLVSADVMKKIVALEKQLTEIKYKLDGPEAKASSEEIPPQIMPLSDRLSSIILPHWESTSAVTKVQTDAYDIVIKNFKPVYNEIKAIMENTIPQIEAELEKAKAPYTPGRLPEWKY